MTGKEEFLEEHEPGDSFYFGSNTFGEWDEDGSVWYNSHNEQQFSFENIDDFLTYYFDDDESVSHTEQYYIGERDMDTGVETFRDGCSKEKDGVDEGEDGSMMWSKIKHYKMGEKQ